MSSVLEDYKKYPGITEAYEVEKTLEVVHQHNIYRIEAVKCYSNPPVHYEIRCWKQEWVVLQQGDTENGKYVRKPERMDIWVQHSLPWVHQHELNLALHQALNFLTGRE